MAHSITVGLTELHGISSEIRENPPMGVNYVEAKSTPSIFDHILRSSAKGVLHRFDGRECDILEAPLFPVRTQAPWIFTPAGLAGATTFNLLGAPLPRGMRVRFLKHLMLQPNFKRLIFKSESGAKTLHNFAKIRDKRIDAKVSIIHPAIRRIEDSQISYSKTGTRFLFVGEFFRKGGANVIDAFEMLQLERDDISLRVCSGDHDFINGPEHLKDLYLQRILSNDSIESGSVSRESMMDTEYPKADVLVSPTMAESFGFALLEASAHGIPVISTRLNAIPEIVEHNKSGFLIDVQQYDFIKRVRYGSLPKIDPAYHSHVTEATYIYMKRLANDHQLRQSMGLAGLRLAREKFSFEKRNLAFEAIYKEALQ